MAFRFFQRKQIFPGVTLNLSKSGPSLSFGPRGFKHTIGPRGRRTTVGLPGTGLHYTTQHGKKRDKARSTHAPDAPPDQGETAPPSPLPDDQDADLLLQEADAARAEAEEDRALLRAMIAFQSGQDRTALLALKNISGVADASWLSGIAHIRSENWQAARAAFEAALENGPALGSRFAANGVNAVIELAITPEITARIEPAEQATRLVLAEAYQASGDLPAAAQILVTALDADRTDPVLAISLAEIALEAEEAGAPVIQLEDLAPHLERQADDPVIAASLVLYRARVAASLGNHRDAAARYEMVSTIMEADDDLAKTALYEQALCLREMGERTRFRQALSALHARDPSFADIRSLLG